MAAAAQPPVVGTFPGHELMPTQRQELVALCTAAFGQDFSTIFALLPGAVHLLVCAEGVLVAHACWVERRDLVRLSVRDRGLRGGWRWLPGRSLFVPAQCR